ncbi:MAG: thiol-disulfide oxidoreductase, partial [Rhodobacteraceae bacterium]|nr:thiol-disulfide oxidoreductase [Paracoccaceae bacterium]
TKDKAAQRLYAFDQGKKYEGVSAFNILWSKMPRYKFLAFIVQIPILNKASNITYDKILAPIIYKMHLKRELKKSINAKVAR